METKKQEAIRLAYGEYWEKVKDAVSKDGYIPYWYYSHYDIKDCDLKITDGSSSYRPKSLSGIEDNNGWQTYEDGNYPPLSEEVLFFNEKWVDEDFNPKGIRIGFKSDEDVTSAHWWDYQSTYISISHSDCEGDESFSDETKASIQPTHWKLIEDKKPIF